MTKKIKIAHLYYDLMNLYGESANVRAMKTFIERYDVPVEVSFLTLDDDIDFMAYDFYYLGSGSEANQVIVLEDLKKYASDIKKAIDSGKMFLVTGNAMEIFGKKIRYRDSSSMTCLGILDYQAYEQMTRMVSEIIYKYEELPEDAGRYILGFKNCSNNIVHNKDRMFGFANNVCKNNFYAMNFIGPFLIRNPYFTNKLIGILFKDKGIDFKPITDTIEFKAYHEFLKNFVTNNDLG